MAWLHENTNTDFPKIQHFVGKLYPKLFSKIWMENVENELKWETNSLVWQKANAFRTVGNQRSNSKSIFTNSDLNLDPTVAVV